MKMETVKCDCGDLDCQKYIIVGGGQRITEPLDKFVAEHIVRCYNRGTGVVTLDQIVSLIVDKLIGPIKPVGDQAEDAVRLTNMESLCCVSSRIIHSIQEVACMTGKEGSIVRAKGDAKAYLHGMIYGIKNEDEDEAKAYGDN
jgi:hypothetical protein